MKLACCIRSWLLPAVFLCFVNIGKCDSGVSLSGESDLSGFSPFFVLSAFDTDIYIASPNLLNWSVSIVLGVAINLPLQLLPYLMNGREDSELVKKGQKAMFCVAGGSGIYFVGSRLYSLGQSALSTAANFLSQQSQPWEHGLQVNTTQPPVRWACHDLSLESPQGLHYHLSSEGRNTFYVSGQVTETLLELLVIPALTYLFKKVFLNQFTKEPEMILIVAEESPPLDVPAASFPDKALMRSQKKFYTAENYFTPEALNKERRRLLNIVLTKLDPLLRSAKKKHQKLWAITGGQALALHQKNLALPIAINTLPELEIRSTDLDLFVFGKNNQRLIESYLTEGDMFSELTQANYLYMTKLLVVQPQNTPVYSHFWGFNEGKKMITVFSVDLLPTDNAIEELQSIVQLSGFKPKHKKLPVMGLAYELQRLRTAISNTRGSEREKYTTRLKKLALTLNTKLTLHTDSVTKPVSFSDVGVLKLAEEYLEQMPALKAEETKSLNNVISQIPVLMDRAQEQKALAELPVQVEMINGKALPEIAPVKSVTPVAVVESLSALSGSVRKPEPVNSLRKKPFKRLKRNKSGFPGKQVMVSAGLSALASAYIIRSFVPDTKESYGEGGKKLSAEQEAEYLSGYMVPDISPFLVQVMQAYSAAYLQWQVDALNRYSFQCTKYKGSFRALCKELKQGDNKIRLLIMDRIHEMSRSSLMPLYKVNDQGTVEAWRLVPVNKLTSTHLLGLINIQLSFALRDHSRAPLDLVAKISAKSALLCGFLPGEGDAQRDWYSICVNAVQNNAATKLRSRTIVASTDWYGYFHSLKVKGTSEGRYLTILPESFSPEDKSLPIGTEGSGLRTKPYIFDAINGTYHLSPYIQKGNCKRLDLEEYRDYLKEVNTECLGIVNQNGPDIRCPPPWEQANTPVILTLSTEVFPKIQLWALINGNCISAPWDTKSCQYARSYSPY